MSDFYYTLPSPSDPIFSQTLESTDWDKMEQLLDLEGQYTQLPTNSTPNVDTLESINWDKLEQELELEGHCHQPPANGTFPAHPNSRSSTPNVDTLESINWDQLEQELELEGQYTQLPTNKTCPVHSNSRSSTPNVDTLESINWDKLEQELELEGHCHQPPPTNGTFPAHPNFQSFTPNGTVTSRPTGLVQDPRAQMVFQPTTHKWQDQDDDPFYLHTADLKTLLTHLIIKDYKHTSLLGIEHGDSATLLEEVEHSCGFQ
jgi:hypothetical protein